MILADRALGLRAGALAAASGIGLAAAPIALPDVATSLDLSASAATIIVTAYGVGLAAASCVAGRLIDLLGTRRTLDLSCLVLALSTLVVIATDLPWLLVAGRAVSGMAGGGLSMAAFVSAASVTEGERGLGVQGLLTATSVSVLGMGPLIGGAFVAIGGWRLALATPLLSLLVLAAVRRRLPNTTGAGSGFDAVGAVLAIVGCALATVAVQSPGLNLGAGLAIAFAAVAVVAVTILLRRARRVAVSMIPTVLLDDRRVRSLAALAAACFGSYVVVSTAVPAQLGRITGWGPVAIGALMLPSALSGAAAALLTTKGAAGREPARAMLGLSVIGAVGLLAAAALPGVVGPILGAALSTAAFAGAQVVLIAATAAFVASDDLGGALGAMNFALLSGGAIGAGLFASLLGPVSTAGALALLSLAPLAAALGAAAAGRDRQSSNRTKAVA